MHRLVLVFFGSDGSPSPVVVVLVVVVVVEAWRLELTQRLTLNSAWLLYLTNIIVRPTARNNNEVARAQ